MNLLILGTTYFAIIIITVKIFSMIDQGIEQLFVDNPIHDIIYRKGKDIRAVLNRGMLLFWISLTVIFSVLGVYFWR